MWLEIIFGLVVYCLSGLFFSGDDDDILDVENLETTDSDALFSVAARLEKLHGGKVYTGLRIPDADTHQLQNIDMVLLTKGGEAVVISVQNLSGFVSVKADGSWVSKSGRNHKTEHHPDPVAEAKRQAAVLKYYIEGRGNTTVPEGYLSCKVICPNPNFCAIHSDYFPPEVVTYEQWIQLKPEWKSMFSGWIKDAFLGGKKEKQESVQKLNFVLSTAPTWDRLELKGNKYLLGEFLDFKGKEEDVQSLKAIKRSKVSRLIVQKTSMFVVVHSKLQVLYCSRDYRNEGASASDWKEVTVRSNAEVLFQLQNSTKSRKFKLSSVVSMSLSA
ncbi:uncharacterized protein LOC127796775 isoform X1 [Diospyros lotus]|uniref:uncharacterized protein LOC127796775 isoform X1 n=1 Tax=Diospyros lotus TaxID=55363 RepID=UPI0022513404|nr:uncharacterized protein LOC127796775 isoform X1 [Diospyros lotus]